MAASLAVDSRSLNMRCRHERSVLRSIDFVELTALGGSRVAAPEKLKALADRCALKVQPESIPALLERFQLRIGEPI